MLPIIGTILEKIVGTLPETVVDYYKEKRRLEQEVSLEVLRGKIKYELVLVFVPYTQDGVMQGFKTLEQTPDWYRWLIMMIFTAIFGIRIWRRKS